MPRFTLTSVYWVIKFTFMEPVTSHLLTWLQNSLTCNRRLVHRTRLWMTVNGTFPETYPSTLSSRNIPVYETFYHFFAPLPHTHTHTHITLNYISIKFTFGRKFPCVGKLSLSINLWNNNICVSEASHEISFESPSTLNSVL
jgi:hypothetical protein